MKRKSEIAVLVVLLLLPGCFLYGANLETVEVRPHKRYSRITGFTYPRAEMTVTSEVNGRCLSITSDVGETIAGSGILAEIDRTFIRLELEANKIARSRVQRQLQEEEKSLERYTKLLSEQSTPQARLDEVALAADLHRLELKALINDGNRLAEQLERYSVSAPADWTVIERYVEPGEYLPVGAPLARLGDFRQLLVPLALTFNDVGKLQELEEIMLHFPEIDLHQPARIYRKSPVLDPKTRKIMIQLIVDGRGTDSPVTLSGGMRVELMLPQNNEKELFEIPSQALLTKYEASWLVRPDGSRLKVINLGSPGDGFTVITGTGLEPGQEFLLNPVSQQ